MIERYQQKGHGNELKNQVDGVILIEVRLKNHILFLSLSFAQLLWNFFTHCTIDAQKVTAISALSRLTIERQLKRGTPIKGESPENRDYLVQIDSLKIDR